MIVCASRSGLGEAELATAGKLHQPERSGVPAVVKDLGVRGASTTTDLLHYFVDRQHLGEKEAESGEGRLL